MPALPIIAVLVALASTAWAGPGPSPEDLQEITIQVVAPEGVVFADLSAELTRAGEVREVLLSDEGLVPGDNGWDGIWVGSDQGPYARYVGTRLFARVRGGEDEVIHSGLEWTPDARRADLGYQIIVHEDGRLEAVQVAVPTPGRRLRTALFLRVAAGFGWGLLALALLAVALLRPAREPRP
jgi:hypothetical protein